MGTALVYHEDMTATRLLWDDPQCQIECPARLHAALNGLRQCGLEQRCFRLPARKASEAELGLVHSPEYVALVRGTQALAEEELQALSAQFDAVYFHPRTYHCAQLAAGSALQLVDAVLTGTVRNGLALVRPPGHHSQRAAANGFCVFNNVAIAAQHAKQKHGLQRILIVDWDIHHGQGIQYIFEDDPSVLYFSWHRYEHGRFWPFLRESDADSVGQGQGRGFTVNLPWNQVGMGNPDYMAAFLRVLLPLAFEFDPELVLVSAGFDSAIGDPEGGYHLESLAQSVCMTVRALLGDPILPLSGPMVPCHSALESIQSVQRAHAPHWRSLQQPGRGSLDGRGSESPPDAASGTCSPPLPGAVACETAAAALSSLLDRLRLRPVPPVPTAAALTAPGAARLLPPDVLCQEASAPREETEAWARPHEALAQDKALTALGKLLYLLDGTLDGQVNNSLVVTPGPAVAATLDVAIRRGLSCGAQRVLCVTLGQLDRPLDLADDGRTLWLNSKGEEAAAPSMFHVCTPLPATTGGFLNCVLGLVLPLAYGFQPDLVLVALGPAHGLQDARAALLASMLQGPAGGRVLVLLEEESAPRLARTLALVLHGQAPPSLGPFSMASPEDIQALTYLRGQLQPQWKMLQDPSRGPLSGAPCSQLCASSQPEAGPCGDGAAHQPPAAGR
ncbi:polyamine deacetylase HDAC10 isoform X2 [Lepus europaeus]|uniref:polyamine deacetylase HDAC10 isoform X2 n=1 Tax=Lepus europaeus TaxID=9983 RepID=UPI002B465334|nr:polyamine deacetylase HDAC10 isoform X2 [Lepus europaeus]